MGKENEPNKPFRYDMRFGNHLEMRMGDDPFSMCQIFFKKKDVSHLFRGISTNLTPNRLERAALMVKADEPEFYDIVKYLDRHGFVIAFVGVLKGKKLAEFKKAEVYESEYKSRGMAPKNAQN